MKELPIRIQKDDGQIVWNYEEVKQNIMELQRGKNGKCTDGKSAYHMRQFSGICHSYLEQLKSCEKEMLESNVSSDLTFLNQIRCLEQFLEQWEEIALQKLEHYRKLQMETKKQEFLSVFMERFQNYGYIGQIVFQNERFWNMKCMKTKCSKRKREEAVERRMDEVLSNLASISREEEEFRDVLLLEYAQTLSMKAVFTKKELLQKINGKILPQKKPLLPKGSMEFKIEGNVFQMEEIEDYFRQIGVKYTRLKEDMPRGFQKHHQLDFDTFIAMDLEHSGSFGSGSGDESSEIIEIGAVKYENGKKVDDFSTLVDPGRLIVPKVVNLTGITDDMVKNQPSPKEAVKQFYEFSKGYILVGHDIKNSDFPFLMRHAKKSGYSFENEYFDTYEYAKKIQEKEGFTKMKLADLAKWYQIETERVHRAYDDADINAKLYLKMKECAD